ncbi:MAG: T9SS type A sorting domain-containing protein [Ignavibacteriae bacterium]|nr:T9SS type A sorting domain-containing protein [Ignavibacteriota bacterium]
MIFRTLFRILKNVGRVLLFTSVMFYGSDIRFSGRVADKGGVGLSGKSVEIFINGEYSPSSVVSGVNGSFGLTITGISSGEIIPSKYSLTEAYPNPTSGISNVELTIPMETKIRVGVYDILGRECLSVVDDVFSSGVWRTSFDLDKFASGVYFVRMSSDDGVFTRKVSLVSDVGSSGVLLSSPVRISDVSPVFSKSSSFGVVDSVRIFGRSILPVTYVLNQEIDGSSVDLGDLVVSPALMLMDRLSRR